MCFPHVRLQDRQQRDNTTPCPNTHRPRNSKADLHFLRCYVAKEGGRIQSGHSSFPFRFDRVYVRDTDCETLLSPVTCMRGATAQFQPFLFPHVWWRDLKDTITARFFRKRRRADRHMSFLPFRFRSFARHGSRSSHLSRACDGAAANSADVCRGGQAVARVAHASALQMQRKAYFR